MELQNTEGKVLNTAPDDEQDNIMQLMQIIQSTDTTPANLNDAFSMLYEQLKPLMYRVAYRMTLNSDDTEDIVNSAFSKFSSYLRTNKYTGRPEPFLVRLIRNAAIDLSRRERRELEEASIEYAENIGKEDDSLKAILLHDSLVKLIGQLPIARQKVIIYTYFYDMSDDEIAVLLDMSRANVQVLRHRALQGLRRIAWDEFMKD